MSSEGSVRERIALLKAEGYTEIRGLFVNVPLEVSLERAEARHRNGMNQYTRFNKGEGGRILPKEAVLSQKSNNPKFDSINAEIFAKLVREGVFTSSEAYDNAGGTPVEMNVEFFSKE